MRPLDGFAPAFRRILNTQADRVIQEKMGRGRAVEPQGVGAYFDADQLGLDARGAGIPTR